MLAEEPRPDPGEPRSPGPVQDLHRNPFFAPRNRPGQLAPVPGHGTLDAVPAAQDGEGDNGGNQRNGGDEGAATRLFQKRTVGSRRGQPD